MSYALIESVLPLRVREEPAATPGTGKLRLLIVEDTPSNQAVLLALLRRYEVVCDVASTGAEALALFTEKCHEIVLIDIKLPDFSGVELTARIRQLEGPSPHSYLIAQTAHALHGQREEFLAAGMNDYLPKPLTIRAFGTAIEQAIHVVRFQQRRAQRPPQ